MVVDLDGLLGRSRPRSLARTCVELGHALGNQHWPAVVKGTRVYVPLTVDRRSWRSVMKTHAFPGSPTTSSRPARSSRTWPRTRPDACSEAPTRRT